MIGGYRALLGSAEHHRRVRGVAAESGGLPQSPGGCRRVRGVAAESGGLPQSPGGCRRVREFAGKSRLLGSPGCWEVPVAGKSRLLGSPGC
jgi:hypothetical protein